MEVNDAGFAERAHLQTHRSTALHAYLVILEEQLHGSSREHSQLVSCLHPYNGPDGDSAACEWHPQYRRHEQGAAEDDSPSILKQQFNGPSQAHKLLKCHGLIIMPDHCWHMWRSSWLGCLLLGHSWRSCWHEGQALADAACAKQQLVGAEIDLIVYPDPDQIVTPCLLQLLDLLIHWTEQAALRLFSVPSLTTHPILLGTTCHLQVVSTECVSLLMTGEVRVTRRLLLQLPL
ncbi:MAG: hypothetical protein FRX49_13530 [Trebouxia sp. A1-2]|nr:MAG: hypothetical protein FRX49_13530 [Trebouxia sp. A1-2]